VSALQGQDALVITLSGAVPKGTEEKLITAAGDAGVRWILPSDFAPDTSNHVLTEGVPVFEARVAIRKAIHDQGKSAYISFVTGFWYEYCLAMPAAFGFDFAKRAVTLFDAGEAKVSLSTWPQIGRAVATLLSLPIHATGKDASLDSFANQMVYINSFTVSQRDILASVLRVTGTSEDDWQISRETVHDRIASGRTETQQGNRAGFAKVFFTALFHADGRGDFEHTKGTQNQLLALPMVDLDEATKVAIERSKLPQWTR
jgi:hypothetical protein